jgi:hypothetical protein
VPIEFCFWLLTVSLQAQAHNWHIFGEVVLIVIFKLPNWWADGFDVRFEEKRATRSPST